MGRVKHKRVSKAAIHRSFAKHYDRAPGVSWLGKTTQEVKIRAPRIYVTDERLRQFAGHLASALKWNLNARKGMNEVEVQVAIIDGRRFLISANDDETVEQFATQLIKDAKKRTVSDVLMGVISENRRSLAKSKAAASRRFGRHGTKVEYVLTGIRLVDDLDTLQDAFGQVSHQACVEFDALDDRKKDLEHFIRGQSSTQTIGLLKADGENWHAEQKILYALVRSGVTDLEINISGTFRPCAGCLRSLNLVKKYFNKNLHFNDNAGHFWATTTDCHIALLKLLLKEGYINAKTYSSEGNLAIPSSRRTFHSKIKTFSGEEEMENYGTDSESEAEEEEEDEELD